MGDDPGLLKSRDVPGAWVRFVPGLRLSGNQPNYGAFDRAACTLQFDPDRIAPPGAFSMVQFVARSLRQTPSPGSRAQLEEMIYEYPSPRVAARVLSNFDAVFRGATKCGAVNSGSTSPALQPQHWAPLEVERAPRGAVTAQETGRDFLLFRKGRTLVWITADPTRFTTGALGRISQRAYQRIHS